MTKWVIIGQSGKEQEQNSVQIKLVSLHFQSLLYRWVMSRASLGACAFWNMMGSMDPSCLSLHPLPSGFQRWGLAKWLWCHTAGWHKALNTSCWKASSVGDGFAAEESVVNASVCLSSSRLVQGWPFSFFFWPYRRRAYFLATGKASFRLPDGRNLAIFFKSVRWVFSLVKAVVFPILYKLLVVSQPMRSWHAGKHSQRAAPRLWVLRQGRKGNPEAGRQVRCKRTLFNEHSRVGKGQVVRVLGGRALRGEQCWRQAEDARRGPARISRLSDGWM